MFSMFTSSSAAVTSILLLSFCGQIMVTIGSAVETKELNGKSIIQERTDISAQFDGPFVNKYYSRDQCPFLDGDNVQSVAECLNWCFLHTGPPACTAVNYAVRWGGCTLWGCPIPVPRPAGTFGGVNAYSRRPGYKYYPGMYWSRTVCPELDTYSNVSLEFCFTECTNNVICTAFYFDYIHNSNTLVKCRLIQCPTPVPEPTLNDTDQRTSGYAVITDPATGPPTEETKQCENSRRCLRNNGVCMSQINWPNCNGRINRRWCTGNQCACCYP